MRWPFIVCLVVAAAAGGCAMTPMPVAGPSLPDGTFSPAVAWGVSHGPSRARLRGPVGLTRVDGNGDSSSGAPTLTPGMFMPVQVQFRGPLAGGLDGRAHLGPYGAGLGARMRLNDAGSSADLFASLDVQLGPAVAYGDGTLLRLPAYAGRALLEAARPAGRRFQVQGAIGLSAGRFRHGVDASGAMDNTNRPFSDNPFPSDFITLVRPELRLEAALGGALVTRWVGVEVALLPYVVLASGAPRAECRDCYQPVALESYSQSYGVMVMVQPFGVFGRTAP